MTPFAFGSATGDLGHNIYIYIYISVLFGSHYGMTGGKDVVCHQIPIPMEVRKNMYIFSQGSNKG